MQAEDPTSKQINLLIRLRWLVPLTLSLLGLIYVLGETFIQHEHESPADHIQVVVGVFLLSVVGPVIAYLGFDWALKTTIRLQEAEGALREQNRQLRIAAEVSRVANRSLDVQLVLGETLDSLMDLIDVESGAIWLRQGDHLELQASSGVTGVFLREESIQPLDKCLCGEAVKAELPLTLAEVKCGRDFLEARCNCEDFEAAIGVPVRAGDEVVGVLEVASSRPRDFTPADRDLLTTVGNQIGLAVEKAQLHQELQHLYEDLERLVDVRTSELLEAQEELAQKAETLHDLLLRFRDVEEQTRARIAGDLHDGVQQLLNGALFQTQAVHQALGVDPGAADRQLEQLQSVLRAIETEMRAAIYSLRPATLDTLGLVAALQECVRTFEQGSSTPCRLTVVGAPRRFCPDAELAAFRITQEALNNVEAHARASQSAVSVEFDEDSLRLEISDDGVGFDLAGYGNGDGRGGRLGLLGMQERAESVGGKLVAQSLRGHGTRIILHLPTGSSQP